MTLQAVGRTSISSVNRSSGVRSEPCSATAATLIPSAVARITPTLRGGTARRHVCQTGSHNKLSSNTSTRMPGAREGRLRRHDGRKTT